MKKAFPKILQKSLENACDTVSFLIMLQAKTCNFIKKETLSQVLFCEFCEIVKNTFFIEHLRWLLLKWSANLTLLTTYEDDEIAISANVAKHMGGYWKINLIF